uniref:Uncharacterized protein n=1 Tax=Arion vulgaris TaxID=1028688 RepID=A0A0B7BUV3_9EUPU
MAHTLDKHVSNIQGLCRTCGEKLLNRKEKKSYHKPAQCIHKTNDIFYVFGINVNNDLPNKHSTSMCRRCVSRIIRIQRTLSENSLKSTHNIADKYRNIWTEFNSDVSVNECSLCFHYKQNRLGCFKNVMNSKPTVTLDTVLHDLPMHSKQPCSDGRDISLQDEVDVTVEDNLHRKRTASHMTCSSTSPMLDSKKIHLYRSKSLQEPLSRGEEELFTHFVRRKLNTSHSHNVITCRTRGQPLVLKKIVKSRKQTSQIKSPTKRKRSKYLQDVRELVAPE